MWILGDAGRMPVDVRRMSEDRPDRFWAAWRADRLDLIDSGLPGEREGERAALEREGERAALEREGERADASSSSSEEEEEARRLLRLRGDSTDRPPGLITVRSCEAGTLAPAL